MKKLLILGLMVVGCGETYKINVGDLFICEDRGNIYMLAVASREVVLGHRVYRTLRISNNLPQTEEVTLPASEIFQSCERTNK